jgi:hypothetical protein
MPDGSRRGDCTALDSTVAASVNCDEICGIFSEGDKRDSKGLRRADFAPKPASGTRPRKIYRHVLHTSIHMSGGGRKYYENAYFETA